MTAEFLGNTLVCYRGTSEYVLWKPSYCSWKEKEIVASKSGTHRTDYWTVWYKVYKQDLQLIFFQTDPEHYGFIHPYAGSINPQSASKLVETLCPNEPFCRFSDLRRWKWRFPSSPPQNVLPLFDPVENNIHDNFEWMKGDLEEGYGLFCSPKIIWGQCLNKIDADCRYRIRSLD